jgi:hypothetical protein
MITLGATARIWHTWDRISTTESTSAAVTAFEELIITAYSLAPETRDKSHDLCVVLLRVRSRKRLPNKNQLTTQEAFTAN